MKSKKIYLSALILGLMGGISSAHSAFGMGGVDSWENEYREKVEEMEEREKEKTTAEIPWGQNSYRLF